MTNFKKPKKFDYNVIVLGGGSAGLVAAYLASALKAKVALVEKNKMGGDCLNTGCVPSKALIRSAKFVAQARKAHQYGIRSATVDFDFADIMERVQKVIKKIEPHDSVERFTSLGVECYLEEATIKNPYTVQVGQQTLTTRAIIVATGATPAIPPLKGMDQITPLTSENVWDLREQPERLVVLGGGPIGCELAQSFQRLGTQVTQVEMGDNLLQAEDAPVATYIKQQLEDEDANVMTGHTAQRIENKDGRFFVITKGPEGEISTPFDQLLVAVGRRPHVKGFGLEDLGVELQNTGHIKANEFLATNYANIFVCGDVTGPYQLTHVASHQAFFACINALFRPLNKLVPPPWNKTFKVNYDVIPWVTYTDPEVATVGLTVKAAERQGIAYELTTYNLEELDRAVTDEQDHGFIRVLTPPKSDKILGATIVSSAAGEMLSEFVAALKNGFGLNAILGTIHPYPTMAEANKFVAGNWKKARKPEKALQWLERFHKWQRG